MKEVGGFNLKFDKTIDVSYIKQSFGLVEF